MLSWAATFKDGSTLDQYPDAATDNTQRFKTDVMTNLENLLFFGYRTEHGWFALDWQNHMFLIRDLAIPFFSENPKLVHFVTRQVTMNADAQGVEHGKIYTLGYEDEQGKVFVNYMSENGLIFFSNEGL